MGDLSKYKELVVVIKDCHYQDMTETCVVLSYYFFKNPHLHSLTHLERGYNLNLGDILEIIVREKQKNPVCSI